MIQQYKGKEGEKQSIEKDQGRKGKGDVANASRPQGLNKHIHSHDRSREFQNNYLQVKRWGRSEEEKAMETREEGEESENCPREKLPEKAQSPRRECSEGKYPNKINNKEDQKEEKRVEGQGWGEGTEAHADEVDDRRLAAVLQADERELHLLGPEEAL